MAGCVAVDTHETVVLSLPDLDDAVQVAPLEEGVELEIGGGLPVLPAEGSARELHVIWGFYVRVGEGKGLVVPRIVRVLVARPQVDDLGPVLGLSEAPSDELVISFALEYDGDGLRQLDFRVPSE